MSSAMRPTANVTLPHQSIFAGLRSPVSRSLRYAQIVPKIPNDALSLGGNVWEVGRCYYHEKFAPELPPDSSEWSAWLRATPSELLDWRDRFYVEQRLAGWLSSIEQGIDLTGRERLHVANCADLFSLLLSLPEPTRRSGRHQLELVRMLAPELARFPVNASETVLGRLAGRFVRLEHRQEDR